MDLGVVDYRQVLHFYFIIKTVSIPSSTARNSM